MATRFRDSRGMDRAAIAGLVGLPANASDETIEAELVMALQRHDAIMPRLEALTGKRGNAALEEVLSWQASHEESQRLQPQLAEIEQKQATAELDKHIAAAKELGKLTPAEERVLREQVAAGGMTLDAARGLLKVKPPHKVLAQRIRAPAVGRGHKSYADMRPSERHKLGLEDRELFDLLRAEWIAEGRPGPGGGS